METCLFPELEQELNCKWHLSNFSADDVCPQQVRMDLEERYWPITEVTERFNRQSVSYQLSKKDCLHSWLKYKEGFSAELVRTLLRQFKIKEGDTVLDPFMGSGTTALVSILNGYNCIGYDILPLSKISIKAKSAVYRYDVRELERALNEMLTIVIPDDFDGTVDNLIITQGAYPVETARAIAYYKVFLDKSSYSDDSKNLIELCMLNSLEAVSYSAKDGQYLRWDYRCPKMKKAVADREKTGRKPHVVKLDKGELPSLKEELCKELTHVINDIKNLQHHFRQEIKARCEFTQGSALYELPKVPDGIINCVITSPPYCNRYDYTRTYALELAYLGVSEDGIKQLRQDLLSCTVENKPKIYQLENFYQHIGHIERFKAIYDIIKENKALQEVNYALKERCLRDEINNKGVLKMVDGYFSDLVFLFYELYRVCKTGAQIAFVNDNVRYAGEVIPVDYMTTDIAERIGFKPVIIYTLKQQKGNSSQQMKRYGRVALRKSITIWQK